MFMCNKSTGKTRGDTLGREVELGVGVWGPKEGRITFGMSSLYRYVVAATTSLLIFSLSSV